VLWHCLPSCPPAERALPPACTSYTMHVPSNLGHGPGPRSWLWCGALWAVVAIVLTVDVGDPGFGWDLIALGPHWHMQRGGSGICCACGGPCATAPIRFHASSSQTSSFVIMIPSSLSSSYPPPLVVLGVRTSSFATLVSPSACPICSIFLVFDCRCRCVCVVSGHLVLALVFI
jgi:hypothetical protein